MSAAYLTMSHRELDRSEVMQFSRGAAQVSPIKPDSPVTHDPGPYKAFYRSVGFAVFGNVGSPKVGGSRGCLPPS